MRLMPVDKKKAAPDGCDIESGMETAKRNNVISKTYCNIAYPQRQVGSIESVLLHDTENAISAAYLQKLTGLSEIQYISEMVQNKREAGTVILSTPGSRCPGYILLDDGEKGQRETAAFMRSMVSRASKILLSVHGARAALGEVDGQQEIEV